MSSCTNGTSAHQSFLDCFMSKIVYLKYGFKYFYQIQIFFTQLHDFSYSNLI